MCLLSAVCVYVCLLSAVCVNVCLMCRACVCVSVLPLCVTFCCPGEPLRSERFALPPGSIACVLSHGAHGVAPKEHTKQTRWCTLFAYRKEPGGAVGSESNDVVFSPGRQLPPVWQAKLKAGALPTVLAELFKGAGDIFEARGGLFARAAARAKM